MEHESPDEVGLTIVLNAMGRLELAELGFRSWMLQESDRPYQVVLSLFNDQQARFDALTADRNPNCRVVIRTYEKPAFFNISGANNLGLHFATGRYVMFANSDIIYPSWYGQRFFENMESHRAACAVGSRYNLTEKETRDLDPASNYSRQRNLDFIDQRWRHVAPAPIWVGCGPWTFRRDILRAIGGFDPKVLVSEDDDVLSRAVHYLARHGQQNTNISFTDLLGYHLYHPSSELFDWHKEAHEIIDAKRDRMRNDPNSVEDVVANNLDDLDALVDSVRKTPKPVAMKRYRQNTIKKVGMRVAAATKVLIGRR